jgi:hypothetical protein
MSATRPPTDARPGAAPEAFPDTELVIDHVIALVRSGVRA